MSLLPVLTVQQQPWSTEASMHWSSGLDQITGKNAFDAAGQDMLMTHDCSIQTACVLEGDLSWFSAAGRIVDLGV